MEKKAEITDPKNEVEAGSLAYTVNAEGYDGVNIREKPNTNSTVVYVALNGHVIESDEGKKTPAGWVAVRGGGFIQKKYLV
jgi:hypothetical protein